MVNEFEGVLADTAGGRVLDVAAHEGGSVRVLAKRPKSYIGIVVPEAQSARFFFKRRRLRALPLPALASVAYACAAPALGDGSRLGVADTTSYWLAISLAALHQLSVWTVFRAQLGWALLSRLFGKADLLLWGIVFIPPSRPGLCFYFAWLYRLKCPWTCLALLELSWRWLSFSLPSTQCGPQNAISASEGLGR